jgi:uncharacterized protein YjbI with pentapeptide repeats
MMQRRRLLQFGLVFAGCAASLMPAAEALEKPPIDAIQCRLSTSEGLPEGIHSTLTVVAGEPRSLTVGRMTLSSVLAEGVFRMWLKAGATEYFSARYAFGTSLPDNRFGNEGFTGWIYVTGPDPYTRSVMTCHSVSRLEHPPTLDDLNAQRAAEARRPSLTATLREVENCAPTVVLREAHDQCPAMHPLPERVDAIVALHRMNARDFFGLNLRGANLERLDLPASDMRETDLVGTNLREASLVYSNLEHTDLQGANLERANLYSTRLAEANLKDANLQAVKLQQADLQNANLAGANLAGAYLMDANLDGANLTGANLTGAVLTGASFNGANLSGTIADNARGLTQRQLNRARGNAATRLPTGLTIRRGRRQ